MIVSVGGKSALSATSKQLIQHHLHSGCILAFPTDTVYGLGVKAGINTGVDALFELKNRDENKPLVMMSSHKDEFRPYVSMPDLLNHIIFDALWPGPLTVVMPFRKETGLYFCRRSSDSIGFRIPNEPLMVNLLSYLNFPLLTTSANLSGKEPFCDGKSIQGWLLSSKLTHFLVVDKGSLQNQPSTVISLSSPDSFRLLRSGCLPVENISSFFSR